MSESKDFIREKKTYKEIVKKLDKAIQLYYDSLELDDRFIKKACNEICLLSYRLIKYIEHEAELLLIETYKYVNGNEICGLTDAAYTYWGIIKKTSIQLELDILQILSRSAFKEMKIGSDLIYMPQKVFTF